MNAIVKEVPDGTLACPFCEGLRLHLEGDNAVESWKVLCDNDDCEAVGPVGPSIEQALAKWNSTLP